MGSLLDIILGKMGALGGPSKAKPSSKKKARSVRSRKVHSKVKFNESKPREASRPRAARLSNVSRVPQKPGGSSKGKGKRG
tara:strand:+ start:37 stop:279 length:243 start_codon:yes stop_codon:yes gene_type:complete